MFGFGDAQQQYDQVYNQDQPDHEGKFSHELLAGGASFAAMKIFEDQQRKEGTSTSTPRFHHPSQTGTGADCSI